MKFWLRSVFMDAQSPVGCREAGRMLVGLFATLNQIMMNILAVVLVALNAGSPLDIILKPYVTGPLSLNIEAASSQPINMPD